MKKVKTLQQNDKLGQWLTFIKVDEMALHDEKARIDEVIKEGIEQGKKQEKIELARNLLDILDDETIALKVGLDIKEVKKIRKETEAGN